MNSSFVSSTEQVKLLECEVVGFDGFVGGFEGREGILASKRRGHGGKNSVHSAPLGLSKAYSSL